MAFLTVRQAAEQVGVSRQTMFRKIKEGKVSATKDNEGQLQIDTAELIRAFGALQSPIDRDTTQSDSLRVSPRTPDTPVTVSQQIEIERLRAQLESKEVALALAHERIQELREREQVAHQERDKLFAILEQQTRLLAAPRPPQPSAPAALKNTKKTTKKSGKKVATQAPEEEPKQPSGFLWPFWPRPL